jgi:hypothetical protein
MRRCLSRCMTLALAALAIGCGGAQEEAPPPTQAQVGAAPPSPAPTVAKRGVRPDVAAPGLGNAAPKD